MRRPPSWIWVNAIAVDSFLLEQFNVTIKMCETPFQMSLLFLRLQPLHCGLNCHFCLSFHKLYTFCQFSNHVSLLPLDMHYPPPIQSCKPHLWEIIQMGLNGMSVLLHRHQHALLFWLYSISRNSSAHWELNGSWTRTNRTMVANSPNCEHNYSCYVKFIGPFYFAIFFCNCT